MKEGLLASHKTAVFTQPIPSPCGSDVVCGVCERGAHSPPGAESQGLDKPAQWVALALCGHLPLLTAATPLRPQSRFTSNTPREEGGDCNSRASLKYAVRPLLPCRARFYERPFLGASGFQGLGFGVSGCHLTFFVSWVQVTAVSSSGLRKCSEGKKGS